MCTATHYQLDIKVLESSGADMNAEITTAMIGFAGVLVGAGVTALKEWWARKAERESTARYLSALLILKLDKLSIDCLHLAKDSGEKDKNGYYRPEYENPTFELPTDGVDWKSLNSDVQLSILNLPYRLEHISSAVSWELGHDSPPDFSATFQQRRYLYAKLGIEVTRLSGDLRKLFGFPRSTVYDWNPVPCFEEVIQSIDQLREKSSARVFGEE